FFEGTFIAFDLLIIYFVFRSNQRRRFFIALGYFGVACVTSGLSLYSNLKSVDTNSSTFFAHFCSELADINEQLVNDILIKKQSLDIFLEANKNGVITFYMAAFFLLMAYTFLRRRRFVLMKRNSKHLKLSHDWQNRFNEIQHILGIKHLIKVTDSLSVRHSISSGFLESFILLPTKDLKNPPTQKSELAMTVALLMSRKSERYFRFAVWIMVLLFVYNPAIWFLGYQLVLQRRLLIYERAKNIQQNFSHFSVQTEKELVSDFSKTQFKMAV
ncbi:MAG: hypothetical protein RL757_3047, partial [Bacteroidota bacterium]